MSSCHHAIMSSCHHVIMSSCHHVMSQQTEAKDLRTSIKCVDPNKPLHQIDVLVQKVLSLAPSLPRTFSLSRFLSLLRVHARSDAFAFALALALSRAHTFYAFPTPLSSLNFLLISYHIRPSRTHAQARVLSPSPSPSPST